MATVRENLVDILAKMMKWEDGELDEEQTAAFFQEMIDRGTVWHLQGSYQREALRLAAAGLVSIP